VGPFRIQFSIGRENDTLKRKLLLLPCPGAPVLSSPALEDHTLPQVPAAPVIAPEVRGRPAGVFVIHKKHNPVHITKAKKPLMPRSGRLTGSPARAMTAVSPLPAQIPSLPPAVDAPIATPTATATAAQPAATTAAVPTLRPLALLTLPDPEEFSETFWVLPPVRGQPPEQPVMISLGETLVMCSRGGGGRRGTGGDR
jgi:hypothetical protein